MARAVFSPDGSNLVINADRGGTSLLLVRPLGSFDARSLPGTENSTRPFFSPDGRWIAFTQGRKLKKVSIEGGTRVDLADSDWGGGTWGADDTIVYTPSYAAGLWRIPAGGGTPERLTDPDTAKAELGHWWPQFLPDGKTILYTSFSTPIDRARLSVYSLETRQQTSSAAACSGGTLRPATCCTRAASR